MARSSWPVSRFALGAPTRRGAIVLAAIAAVACAHGPRLPGSASWEAHRDAAKRAYAASRFDEAEAELRAALAIAEGAGPRDPRIPVTLDALGDVLLSEGRDDDAEASDRGSLAWRERELGADHIDVTASLTRLVELDVWRGDYAEAGRLYERVLAIREARLGPNDPLVAVTLRNIARGKTVGGEYEEAERLYQRALAIEESALGKEDVEVGWTLAGYAELLRATGRTQEASDAEARSQRIRERAAR